MMIRSLLSLFIFFFLYSFTNAQTLTEPWWKRNNLRVIQANLPAYEAAILNPDSLVKDLINYSANTLIINAGGIMAFYKTKLDFHYINPYMKDDMLEHVVKKCHQHNIKVIVRFDFSRVHESIFKLIPIGAIFRLKTSALLIQICMWYLSMHLMCKRKPFRLLKR